MEMIGMASIIKDEFVRAPVNYIKYLYQRNDIH